MTSQVHVRRVRFAPSVSCEAKAQVVKSQHPLRSVLKPSIQANVVKPGRASEADIIKPIQPSKYIPNPKTVICPDTPPRKKPSGRPQRVAQLLINGRAQQLVVGIVLHRPVWLLSTDKGVRPSPRPIKADIRLYAHMSDAKHLLVSCESCSPEGFLWNDRHTTARVLLTHSDKIEMTPFSGTTIRFEQIWQDSPLEEDAPSPVDHDKLPKPIALRYAITPRVLGTGSYGTVWLAWDKKQGRQVACKTQSKEEMTGQEAFLENAQREKTLLREMAPHPNVNGLLALYENSKCIYHFLEIVTGGDLFGLIHTNGALRENHAKAVIYQLLLATEFLHQQRIAHRDIKPENVLLVRPYVSFCKRDDTLSSAPIVQLADFGLSCKLDSPSLQEQITQQHPHSNLALTPCGTVSYHSPELLISSVTYQGYCPFKLDMWTLGCVSFICLFAAHPFDTNPPLHQSDVAFYVQEFLVSGGFVKINALIKRDLVRAQLEEDRNDQERIDRKTQFVHDVFCGVDWDVMRTGRHTGEQWIPNENVIGFMSSLLRRDPEARSTAKQALSMPWITTSLLELRDWYDSDVLLQGAESVCPDIDTVRPVKKTKREESKVVEEPVQAPPVVVKKEGSYAADEDLSGVDNGQAEPMSEPQTSQALDEAKKHIAGDADAPIIEAVSVFSKDPFEPTHTDVEEDRASRGKPPRICHDGQEDRENIPPSYGAVTSAAGAQCKDIRKTHYGRKPRVLKSRLLTGAML